MAETPQDRLIRYIQDAHASEVGIVGALKDFIAEVDNVQVKAVFQEHLAVTESQAARLEQRLIALGSGASDGKGFLNTVLGKVANVAQHPFHDSKDKTTQDLIKAYATEHLEIGMYESLYSYARSHRRHADRATGKTDSGRGAGRGGQSVPAYHLDGESRAGEYDGSPFNVGVSGQWSGNTHILAFLLYLIKHRRQGLD